MLKALLVIVLLAVRRRGAWRGLLSVGQADRLVRGRYRQARAGRRERSHPLWPGADRQYAEAYRQERRRSRLRYAGNDLACQNCHLNAGLQPFAAPFVSTFATFPMFVDDQVLTLTQALNGCMRRSLNGKDLPPESREMEALVAYIKFLGKGTPEGVRIAGMGLRPIAEPDPAARRTARRGGLCQALRQLSQGGRAGRAAPAAGDRLHHPAALGRRELQCRRRHGQDRLCRVLYSRQHAVRHRLSRAGAHRAAGLGRRRLHDLEAASAGDAGNRVRAAIRRAASRLMRDARPLHSSARQAEALAQTPRWLFGAVARCSFANEAICSMIDSGTR